MARVPQAIGVGTSGYQTVEVSAGTFHEVSIHLKGTRTRVTWVRAVCVCCVLPGATHVTAA